MNWLLRRVWSRGRLAKEGAHNAIDLLGAHVYTSS
jgi:hypothetical protein